MRFKTIFLSSAVLLFAAAGFAASVETAAQSDADHKTEATHHDHHAAYVKPGAAVAMSHDYDGQTNLGEFETVTLTLTHMYETGHLSVEILPTSDLQIFSNMPVQNTPLHNGSVLSLPIQFTGTVNGTYSIAIETVYTSPDGQQSRRVLSLPVTIGASFAGKTRPASSKTVKPDSNSYIALPAQEVIR